jgi:hypothetical protein
MGHMKYGSERRVGHMVRQCETYHSAGREGGNVVVKTGLAGFGRLFVNKPEMLTFTLYRVRQNSYICLPKQIRQVHPIQ